jgi:hypothetical protein
MRSGDRAYDEGLLNRRDPQRSGRTPIVVARLTLKSNARGGNRGATARSVGDSSQLSDSKRAV